MGKGFCLNVTILLCVAVSTSCAFAGKLSSPTVIHSALLAVSPTKHQALHVIWPTILKKWTLCFI